MAQPYYPPPAYQQQDPTNVMGKRIGAFFIDAALVIAFGVILFAAMANRVTLDEALDKYDCTIPRGETRDSATTLNCDGKFSLVVNDDVYLVDIGPYAAASLIPSFLYFAVLAGAIGATLGKLATGIRVVTKDTGEIQGIGRGVVRWLFFFVDGPFTLYICGLVTSLVSKGHRRVGDMVGGTLVVGKEYVGLPPMVPGLTAPAAGPYVPPGYGPPTGYPAPPPGYPAPPPGYPAPPPGYPAPPPGYPAPPPMAPPGWPAGPSAPAQPEPAPTEAPLPPTQPSDEPTSPQPPPASPTGVPAWDRERGAWMQWDPARGSWMVWNPAVGVWVPA